MQHLIGHTDANPTLSPRLRTEIKALILDDSAFDRQRLRRLAKDMHLPIEFAEVSSISGLTEALDACRYDVIFIDYVLPKGNGIEALELVRNHYRNRHSATIMLTGDDRSEVAVDSLRNGCTDYVFKGSLTSEILRNRITQAIEIEAEQPVNLGIAKPDSEIEELAESATHDSTIRLQSQLAQIISTLRATISEPSADPTRVLQELEAIEKQCMQMWVALMDRDPFFNPAKETH
ncbi:MAG: response regulator [Arenibacterium sp.]